MNTKNPKFSKKELSQIEQKIKLENIIKGSSTLVILIGAFSIINSLFIYTQSNINFIISLGMTQVIDHLLSGMNSPQSGLTISLMVGLTVNFILSAFFILLGYLGRKHIKWAFIVGWILYLFDSIIYIYGGDFVGFAGHVFALAFIQKGYSTLKELSILEEIQLKKQERITKYDEISDLIYVDDDVFEKVENDDGKAYCFECKTVDSKTNLYQSQKTKVFSHKDCLID